MASIKVDENDPVGELEPSFPFRDVKILHNVDVRDYYDLKEEIGRGKFGTVYRCVEKKSGTVLAAKFVPIAKKQDRINVEREVEIMRKLQHPRLIQLYDSFEIHNVMCVVLELIEGGELFERVIDDDFILTEKACSVFMRQICEGVDFIHQNQIIHLDLKPENILCLTRTGNRIKIIDFGLARKYDPNKKLQVLFGTPEFVAPEVVNFDEITSATDMWSVGVICYVLLSGLSPFMGENDVETMTNVTMAQYDFDDEAFDTISGDAKDFIGQLLVKSKEKRMTASDCLNHQWLIRKPPPPNVFLEESKENLKTYVDSNHSSPFILSESYPNGSVDNIELIPSAAEIAKPKAGSPDKTLELYQLAPENPEKPMPYKDEKSELLEKTTKLNEINREKSANPEIIIEPDTPSGEAKELTLPTISLPPEFKFDKVQSRKLSKTDSFKGLPRKFSITFMGGSRDLPRRSSLTRADKAKNEIKRENIVTFIGPREIKPIDPLSPEIKKAVEELTNYLKLSMEESGVSDVELKKERDKSALTIKNKGVKAETIVKNDNKIETTKTTQLELATKKPVSTTNKRSEKVTSTSAISKNELRNIDILSNSSSISIEVKSDDRVKKKDDIPPLLRPADYIKSANLSKEAYYKSLENKVMETVNTVDKKVKSLFEKTANVDTVINSSKSLFKELSNSQFSRSFDSRESTDVSQTRNLTESVHKRQTSKSELTKAFSVESQMNQSKIKSKENSMASWFSTAIKKDLTVPRKLAFGLRNNDSTNSDKDLAAPSVSESNKTRASSLGPKVENADKVEDQSFKSRFLKSSPVRCSSEAPVGKYEEFKTKYINYKELSSDTEKLLKKNAVEFATSSEKKEKSVDVSASSTQNSRDTSTSKASTAASQIASSSNFMSRQKFKLTEQQRDSYNKFDSVNRLNKTSSFTAEIKESLLKCSLKSTDTERKKVVTSEKDTLNPKKAV